ncbi:metallophosphoesterase family protein [Chitinophaga sp. GbtcB8]|uniref:purple acid phosphatase family protein n=1 Tax=Chitinophaga sp. GbtcB8 TaxID=2824753 RepID=UPI001C30E185|nr:metallophosphoesterase family protein [Chitinophaga sp. GbtcB8]
MKQTLFLLACMCIIMAGSAPANAQEQRNPTVVPVLLRGPYLQVATSNSIIIRWRTTTMTRSVVNYGTAANQLESTAQEPALTFEHQVKLTGLTPRTRYYYAIGGGHGAMIQGDSNNHFVTLPVPGTEGAYRIGVFGDCGNNSTRQRDVRDQVEKYIANKPMDAWILLGDNAYTYGQDPEFQEKFFNIYKDDLLKKYAVFPSPGNHDYNDLYQFKATAQTTHDIAYYHNFSMPTEGEAGGVPSHTQAFYSFDIGNIHFLSLDSYGKEDNATRLYDTTGAQVQWIKKDLEAFKNTKRGWVIAYWHHPPYTMGSHNSDREGELVQIRQNFIRILERYGVDLILCGHSHLYERSRLMKGHYGMEATFDSSKHVLDHSTALYDGSEDACPYIKDGNNTGTVYVVTGSAGASGNKQMTYPHNAMYYSNYEIGGASMLEVDSNRLELKWICADGQIRDHFVMMKDVNKHQVIHAKKGEKLTLTASFIGEYKWKGQKKATSRSLQVTPKAGKTVYEVEDVYNCVKDVFEVNVK